VEILSTMREREPALPEVDAAHMASLQTLGQIVDYMNDHGGFDAAPAASAPAEEPAEAPANIGRYALREVDAPALGMTPAGLGEETLWVTDDGQGVAPALIEALAARGLQAAMTNQVPEGARAVVFLGGLAAPASVDEALEINRAAFRLARQLAPALTASGGLFVTAQSTGGDFGLRGAEGLSPWTAGLSGLVKTAAQEWPAATLRAIDMERGGRSAAELAEALADELVAGGTELEVGLRADGRRTTLQSVKVDVTPGTPALSRGDVVVASGGARGVTAATMVALARATGARFVLLGRTPLADEPAACAGVEGDAALKRALLGAAPKGQLPTPAALGRQVKQVLSGREIRATLAAITAAGAEARYVAVDVTDTDAVRAALGEVRASWGPVSAIVHGAGVLADKRIAEKTDDRFNFVFDTKIGGLRALLDACAGDPLKAICLFSSVAARSGNQGQCDYAMANEILNKVAGAEAARRPGCRVKSLGWGPWEGGMVTPALKAHFAAMGVALIPLEVGAKMLVDELACAEDVELVLGAAPAEGPGIGGSREYSLDMEVRLSRATHPFLADHSVKGAPVVPVVLVLEWFVRAARACRPDLHLKAVRDLRVLSGVTIKDFDAVTTLRVRCRQLSNGDGAVLGLELWGARPAPHYSATAEMTERPARAPGRASGLSGLEAWGEGVYGDVLFHGPDFQVIRELEGVSAEGMSATLEGTAARGWGDGATAGSWRTDVAAMDGGLQMALLWTRRVLGGASLPTGFSAFFPYQEGAAAGALRCVLRRRDATGSKAVVDLLMVDAEGAPVAEFRGVETHLLPGEAAAPAEPRPRA
jgi:hypothetical protein